MLNRMFVLPLMLTMVLGNYPFRCPVHQEWYYRAKTVCNKTTDYRCIWDANLKRYVEQCKGRDIQMKGHKLIHSGDITRWPCNKDRYQPFMHTTDENSLCVYQKSLCNEIGQIVYSDGSGTNDTTCRCNHTAGYKFVHQPKHYCYCQPAIEDCSCFLAMCPYGYHLDIDYKCRPDYDDFDWKSTFKCIEIKHCNPEPEPELNLLKVHSIDEKISSHSKLMAIPVIVGILVEIACFILWIYITKHSLAIEEKEEELQSHERKLNTKETVLTTQEEHMMELESVFDTDYLKQRLEACTNQQLRLGVTGGTGVGKSTFINLLLDTKEGDENFAKTGHVNTTRDVKMYRHPKCVHFTVTDMPGYNSDGLTKDIVFSLITLSDFDYFLLFFQNDLREDDISMAKTLEKQNIPFSFVRTKLDLDINEIYNKSKGKNKKEEIYNLKRRQKTVIDQRMQNNNIQLFLISSIKGYLNEGDLVILIKEVTSLLPEDKSQLFLFFLQILTPETIEMKFLELEKRIQMVALLASARAALSKLPFINKYETIENELKNYVNVFGLDNDYVVSVPGLKHDLFKQDISNFNWKEYLIHDLTKLSIIDVDALRHSGIYILKSLFAGPSNYRLFHSYLYRQLETLRQDALTVYDYCSQIKQ